MKRKIKIEMYRDKSKQVRSRILATNGKIIFDSGESYKTQAGAMKAVGLLLNKIEAREYEVIRLPKK